MGRDVGAVYHAYSGNKANAFGIFTAGGANVPERYLPEQLSVPMLSFRAGINNDIDSDILTVSQTNRHSKNGSAFYINGFYVESTLIGHGNSTNIKYSEKSILTDSNYNPYISAFKTKGKLMQIGVDGVIKKDNLITQAELNYGKFENKKGEIKITGGYVSSTLKKSKLMDASIRYAFLAPDKNSPIGDDIIHEITPGLAFYVRKQTVKFILDAPIQLNAPTRYEAGTGTYVLTEQPDQVKNPVLGRQKVLQLRLLTQFSF